MAGHDQRPDDGKIQTGGREANAAQPFNASDNEGGAERYPPVRQDDAVESPDEPRTFAEGNPAPRQGAGDGTPSSANEGRLGPGADPAEGKR